MRQILIVSMILTLAGACSTPGQVEPVRAGSAYELPIVKGPSYLGVVFPATQPVDVSPLLAMKVREYWTPTPDEVAKFEGNLRDALERGANDPSQLDARSGGNAERRAYVAREIGSILQHLTEFRRQYVGVITADGAKRIVVNCFPGQRGDRDTFSDWRQRLVFVMDGGFWFWHIQYDMATGQYLEFESNGYA